MCLYPKFKNGKKELTRAYGKTAVSMMNITVYRLKAGEELEIAEPGMETALLILEGDVTMYCEDKEYGMKRKSVFTELPTCLHVSKDVAVIVKANAASEILVQSTENEKVFATRLFRPEDCVSFVSCEGRWENTAVRDVVDIINIKNSPYSNMVLGEVYARQGRWWSYIPHDHPQPEVYYYKFERPEGFGACFIGDKAYTVKDGSVGIGTATDIFPYLNDMQEVIGGRGLLIVFQGFYNSLAGKEEVNLDFDDSIKKAAEGRPANNYEQFHADLTTLDSIEFAYCTEFFVINLKETTKESDIDVFRDRLMKIGDCVLVIGDLDLIKTHVHTNNPDCAIKAALKLGELDGIKIENMMEQHRKIVAAREKEEAKPVELKPYAMVSVCAGDGMDAIPSPEHTETIPNGLSSTSSR